MLRLPKSVHTVTLTLHPAFAMRGMPQMWTSIYTALGRGKRWAQGPEGPSREWDIVTDPTFAQFEEYLETRSHWKEMAVDIETPRDNPLKITMCGFSIMPFTAMVVPWVEPFISIARPALADPTVVKSGHNFGYDERALMEYDCDVAWPIWNTIEAESLLYPPFKEARKRRWLALKPTCLVRHFDGVPFFGEADDPRTRAMFRASFPEVPDWLHPRFYCGCDAMWTRLLRIAQRRALVKAGMLNTMTEYVAPAHPTLVRMEARGLPKDEPRTQMLLGYLEAKIGSETKFVKGFTEDRHETRLAQLRQTKPTRCEAHPRYTGATKPKRKEVCGLCLRLYEEAAPLRKAKTLGAEFKPGSDDHWRWLLFAPTEEGGLGMLPLELTEKRKLPKVDNETIETLQQANQGSAILNARVALQQLSHTQTVLKVPADPDGRCRMAFSQHRTETQRFASGKDDDEDGKLRGGSAGNAQNKKDIERSVYCAGDEEFVFFEWDLRQIELWVMAWKAKDMPLLKALHSGKDIHSLNAATIFGCGESREEADSFMVPFQGRHVSARYACKRYTHGADYGMGDKLAGKMYQPCKSWSLQRVTDFIVTRWSESYRTEGVSPETVRRLLRGGQAQHARLYEYANTLVAHGWKKAYFGRWKGLAEHQKQVVATVERDGYLVNSFGYRLKFWNFERKGGHRVLKDREEALAFVPQSDVAFMAKRILGHEGEMDACCEAHGGELLLTNHDAFGGRIPKKSLGNFHVASRPIVERAWPELGKVEPFGEFRSRADFMVGWNWGKKHEHSEKCGGAKMPEWPWAEHEVCEKIENTGGLVEWKR